MGRGPAPSTTEQRLSVWNIQALRKSIAKIKKTSYRNVAKKRKKKNKLGRKVMGESVL